MYDCNEKDAFNSTKEVENTETKVEDAESTESK